MKRRNPDRYVLIGAALFIVVIGVLDLLLRLLFGAPPK